jgi:predicted metal-dependent HD superfamily phosphohydrolase
MNIERWLRLMEAWGFEPNRKTYESLMAAYSERGRHYHTIEHISACLRHLDGCVNDLESPREVEIALWFHDAIYKPLSSNNEKESADWAASFMSEYGATVEEVARVHRLIVVTEHNAPTQTKDESVLVDIDLSILGADPASYDIFEKGVRKEYMLVPSFIYRKKRAEVLRGFMERPKIYTSGCLSTTAERQAKENLSNAISKLEGRA